MTEHLVSVSRPLLIREPKATDQGYVASTWSESLAQVGKHSTRGKSGVVVDSLLDHPTVRVLLACEPDKPRVILGWICWSPVRTIRLVHYVYVRASERNRGIAAALRTAAGLDDKSKPLVYTLKGPMYKQLMEKYPGAIEQPIGEFLS